MSAATSSHRRPGMRYASVALLLLLMLPITWGIRAWRISEVEHSIAAMQNQAVADALVRIEGSFDALQDDLLAAAQSIARDPEVVRNLREHVRTGGDEGVGGLVAYFADLQVPDWRSLELFDVTPRLVAWNGFSMPLDAATASTRFLQTYQTAVVEDAGVRRAIAVWVPVREGDRVLGAVRAMRMIQFDAPIQNEYLRDLSLVEQWERETRLPVRVSFDPAPTVEQPMRGQHRLLQGVDGTVLGRVVVQPPAPDQLVAAAEERFDHVLAFWAVLLVSWLMAGLWGWYRRRPHRRRAAKVPHLLVEVGRFGVVAAGWWLLRYLLIFIDVPARWQRAKAPFAPLFDPSHLASTFGWGLFRSTGDLLITGVFAVAFAVAFVGLADRFLDRKEGRFYLRDYWRGGSGSTASHLLFVLIAAAAVTLMLLLSALLASAAGHVVLDSTVDFFGRGGLLPDPLVLIVFCALLLLTIAVILLAVGLTWIAATLMSRFRPKELGPIVRWGSFVVAVLSPVILSFLVFGLNDWVPWPVAVAFVATGAGLGIFGLSYEGSWRQLLILRTVLPAIFLMTVLLYPLLFAAMQNQRRIQMIDAAELFAEGRDPRVLFGIDQMLEEVEDDPGLREMVLQPEWGLAEAGRLDSLVNATLQGSLLASLAAYDVSVTVFDSAGTPLGRYYDTGQVLDRSALDRSDADELSIMRAMYRESGTQGALVEPVTGRREPDRFQYEGVIPVVAVEDTVGWMMGRAEPQSLLHEGGTPFPRVLLPSGSYNDLYATLSIAEFLDGVLVRSIGRDFGRYRLSDAVQQVLVTRPEVWRSEDLDERTFLTYYRRRAQRSLPETMPPIVPTTSTTVVAVRVPAVNIFDHLFYLLRLTLAGLFIGMPVYLGGLWARHQAGLLPAPRVRYRDKVLNAFLGVGIITVAAVGFVGLRVVTGENERAIQSWLRQHLERVETALALEVRGDEMPYRVLERTRVDSLAARVGLDLNIYQGWQLEALNRPQLRRERLIDRRLPIEAYNALFYEGYRLTYTEEQVGSFEYTAGYQALPDEQGYPRYILSVPTLPEQERIEEERARTVAYLFGALLLLVLVVMLTASLLANALARPIARLRSGLQAVAQGRFERVQPLGSRDEISELVETFNEMQAQLAESRRKLAQQERQLAWREMARQVAHEIKNPLTPMKLSVQHLRRAFESDHDSPSRRERFTGLFERITTTLIEQIDTLARIANEFHSFARMPSRILERLDLNAVAEEAVALMQEESGIEITVDTNREPLVVEADREELRRNYINLIKNAVQAIPEGQHGRISVTTEREVRADRVYAFSTVSDNGIGVAAELQEKIFEPNFSTKTSGTGLGLAIARKSVEELNGEIGFDTDEGQGTTFWIRLPLVE